MSIDRFWRQLFGQDRFCTRTLRALESRISEHHERAILHYNPLIKEKKIHFRQKCFHAKTAGNGLLYTLFNYELPVNIFCPWVSQQELIRNEVIRNRHENFLFQSKILPCVKQREQTFTKQESDHGVSEIQIKNSGDFNN